MSTTLNDLDLFTILSIIGGIASIVALWDRFLKGRIRRVTDEDIRLARKYTSGESIHWPYGIRGLDAVVACSVWLVFIILGGRWGGFMLILLTVFGGVTGAILSITMRRQHVTGWL